jgi:putative restriction endonuclease
MNFFVAVTDNDWFRYLAKRKPDEVNFWRPKAKGFGAVPPGAPFLFKLHSPLDYIVGGGFFVRSERLPLSLAWDAFEDKNGAASLRELRSLILSHRGDNEIDPEIGCVILNAPFFFPRDKWIPAPTNWACNIVTGKTYSTDEEIGKELWDSVTRLTLEVPSGARELNAWREQARFGAEYLAKCRLGQGAFRILVTDAYGRSCAMSGERTLPVLEAAHIKPFVDSGPTRVDNGLLLRADLHKLFDRGYITVTPDFRVEVSRRLKDDFDNGRDYYPLHGKRLIVLPRDLAQHPSREFLGYHNEHVYRG